MNTIAIEAVVVGHNRGWSFTPLVGKRPKLKGWQSSPRETAIQAEAWAKVGNVGLRTGGTSGVAVIDIEASHAHRLGEFPRTVTVKTGGGGYHLYYRANGPIKNSVRTVMGDGVDVRGDGGQVVFVGSIHPVTGKHYVWADGLSPDDVPMADFPDPPAKRRKSLRAVIIDQMAKCGVTRNALADAAMGRVGRSSVYDFIDGKHDLASAKVDAILDALDSLGE